MADPIRLAYQVPVAPDPLDVVIDFVAGLGLEGVVEDRVGSELPTQLEASLPYVLVDIIDGGSDLFGIRPVFDLHVFAGRYPLARSIAARIESALLGYPFRVSSGGRSVLVDSVEVSISTREVEWQRDSVVRRFQGTYSLSIRR